MLVRLELFFDLFDFNGDSVMKKAPMLTLLVPLDKKTGKILDEPTAFLGERLIEGAERFFWLEQIDWEALVLSKFDELQDEERDYEPEENHLGY